MEEMHNNGPETPLIQHPVEVTVGVGVDEIVVEVTPLDIAKAVAEQLKSAANDTALDRVNRLTFLKDMDAALVPLSEEQTAEIDPQVVKDVLQYRIRRQRAQARVGRLGIRRSLI